MLEGERTPLSGSWDIPNSAMVWGINPGWVCLHILFCRFIDTPLEIVG